MQFMPGAEPMSHRAGSHVGVVVLHGFTGNPSSMRGVADAMVAAGFDIELPCLPGHGTVVDDMVETGWSDWFDATLAHVDDVARRTEHCVVVGQSMGGALAVAAAAARPSIGGVVAINPITQTRDAATMEMIDEFIADGMAIAPGEGSDIADPDSADIAYDGTPLRALRSLLVDGLAPLADRIHEIHQPLRLFTSRQDHVVDPSDSEWLAAEWGGPVEHTWLERSYHVATLDHDRQIIIDEAVRFVGEVGSPSSEVPA